MFADMAIAAADAVGRSESAACRGFSAAFRRSIPSSSHECKASACWIISMSSPCTDFHWIGITGRSTNGRIEVGESRQSLICRSGSPKLASPASAPKKCRNSACAELRNCSWAAFRESIGIQLYDLPRAWPATTRHREAEGSFILPALLHGFTARGWFAETRVAIISQLTGRTSEFVSGLILKIIVLMMLSVGCAGSE